MLVSKNAKICVTLTPTINIISSKKKKKKKKKILARGMAEVGIGISIGNVTCLCRYFPHVTFNSFLSHVNDFSALNICH